MKRKSLLFMLLFALLAPWAAQAQTTVEIGDGTTTQYYVPIGTYYNYSITEQLYTAEEIGTAGTISSISFNYAGTAAKDFPITVYMANVDAADLSTGISLADADEVFDGTLSVTGAGWATIDLDTPFAYDGSSNLLIGINKGYVQWYSGGNWYGTAATNMARYTQNDSSPYTTSTIPGGTGSAYSTRPNIQMVITAGSGPVCDKPETLEATNVTANSATLTWTGGSGTYNVEYKGGDAADWTAYLSNTSATTVNLTSLTPGTTYSYRVQSVCGEDVSGWKSVTFMTMFGIPLVESFGTAIPTGWSIYNGLLETVLEDPTALATYSYGWSFGSNNGVFDDHARINIYGTSCKYWLVMPTVTMEDNVQLQFDLAYTAYSGTATDPQTTGTDDKFVVLANVGRGWTILRQWDNAGSEYVLNDLGVAPITVRLDLSAYAGQPIAIAFYGESTESNADNNLHIDNVSIDYKAACETPTSLAVNYEGGTTATVTWADADACDIDVNGTVYTNKTSPFELTGLELATVYEVAARANCGTAGVSDWVDPVSFHTDLCLPEDMCAITFDLVDSYGDGWNDAAIQVYDYDTISEELTLLGEYTVPSSSSSANYTLNVCDGRFLVFFWSSGSYDSECSYAVYDNLGDPIFSGSGAMSDYELFFMNCNSTCRMPRNFAASEITGHEVTLSWTELGEATSWTLAYMAETDTVVSYIEDITTNPYLLEGLEPQTKYYAMISPNCEDQYKWSDVITWTTTDACPKPVITVVPTPTSAEVSWTGLADEYTFEWAVVPAAGAKDALWLQYDDGTMVSEIGNSSANTWTWGVMYPADMLEGNGLVSKVSIYETSYNTEDITINIYSGGDDAPGELVYTETVTPEGAGAFHEITLAEQVIVDPTQNLWITLTEYGTYVMPYCQNGDNANNDWVLNGSAWAHIGDLAASLAGDTWMIRAYVEPAFDPNEIDWQPITGATSPVTLSPLTPETQYAVRIMALCGGEDGESKWSTVYFWTPSLCTTPFDLAANDVAATSADLSWTGYQESYNLRYRQTLPVDPSTPATIILEAHDVWEDESGYQMLLDATHSLFGDVIPVSGPLTAQGSCETIPADLYDAFTYTIPEDADPSCDPENFVFDGSVTIQIPAGTYDWCIVNPSSGDRIWIVGEGDIAGRYDDYVFEPGVTYHFTMQRFGTGDGAAFEVIRDWGDWTTVENVPNPYAFTGLTPETDYEWQVQGVNCSEGNNTDWSEIATFTTTEQTNITQTIALVAGQNYFSTYVEITLDDLKAALLEALPGTTSIKIQSKTQNLTYNGTRWRGSLTSLDVALMYKIDVLNDCEIALTGMPLDPAEHPITIVNGANWIGFPFATSMSLADAFAGFAVTGDKVSSKTSNSSYNGTRWRGTLSALEPGQGYIYNSAATEDRTFTYMTISKAAQDVAPSLSTSNMLNCKKMKKMTELSTIELKTPDRTPKIFDLRDSVKLNIKK